MGRDSRDLIVYKIAVVFRCFSAIILSESGLIAFFALGFKKMAKYDITSQQAFGKNTYKEKGSGLEF